jgi:hypothetical protein
MDLLSEVARISFCVTSIGIYEASGDVSSPATVRFCRSGSQPPQADGFPVGAVLVMFVKATPNFSQLN